MLTRAQNDDCTDECDVDPAKALALTVAKDQQRGSLFFWSTLKPIVVEKPVLQYKYAVLGGGHFIRWEDVDKRRTLRLSAATPQIKTVDTMDQIVGRAATEAQPLPVTSQLPSETPQVEHNPIAALQAVNGVIIVGNLLPVNIRRVIKNGRVDFEVSWNHDSQLSNKRTIPGQNLRCVALRCGRH